MKRNTSFILALLMGLTFKSQATETREEKIGPFVGKPVLESKQLFKNDRMPNAVVGMDGSILAFWNGVICRRSEDGGETFGQVIEVGKGFMGGGVTVDETTGSIFAFVEDGHPPSKLSVYRSDDHAKTWQKHDCVIKKDKNGHIPSMHMNEHGITLRHGEHKGRIIRPSRWYAGKTTIPDGPSTTPMQSTAMTKERLGKPVILSRPREPAKRPSRNCRMARSITIPEGTGPPKGSTRREDGLPKAKTVAKLGKGNPSAKSSPTGTKRETTDSWVDLPGYP